MTGMLLDQGLAPATAAILRQRGFDAVHVLEIGLDRADDADILAAAAQQNRTCVTLDHDFHTHLALAGSGRPSVILLRIAGLGASGQADLIKSIYVTCGDALDNGAAVSADGKTMRIRRLPLR
jgi:predicted nuclease of predicted toxin-antitoxin system